MCILILIRRAVPLAAASQQLSWLRVQPAKAADKFKPTIPLRIVIEQTDYGTAAHVDGVKASRSLKSFDVELPEIEKYLQEGAQPNSWRIREFIGIELLQKESE